MATIKTKKLSTRTPKYTFLKHKHKPDGDDTRVSKVYFYPKKNGKSK